MRFSGTVLHPQQLKIRVVQIHGRVTPHGSRPAHHVTSLPSRWRRPDTNEQQSGKNMKSKKMRTLLSLIVMGMIVVLNTKGQTLKPGQPPQPDPTQIVPTRPVQTVPTRPAQTVPTQPAQTVPTRPAQTVPTRPVQTVPTQPVQTAPIVPAQTVPTQSMPTNPFVPAQPVPTQPMPIGPEPAPTTTSPT
jgi:hypothetical protein